MPEQVQDFYPTPSTRSTCIYYTGVDPDTMQTVYVPKKPEEKRMQRALLQYRLPQNRDEVKKAYLLAGLHREDKHAIKKNTKVNDDFNKKGVYSRGLSSKKKR